jgi:hypothetical protein
MTMVLWVAYLFADGCMEWDVTMGPVSVQASWELDICVLCDSPFDVFTNSTLFILGNSRREMSFGNRSVLSGFLIDISSKDF